MNPIFAQQIATERIHEMHRAGGRARLARQTQIAKPSPERVLTVPANTSPAPGRAHPGASVRRWTRARAAIGSWFDHGHLGPVDNYVTR
jgi:hypothetical protein